MQVGNLSVEVVRVGENGLKLRVAGQTYGVEGDVTLGQLQALAGYLMPEKAGNVVNLAVAEEILGAGVRSLARRRHPDVAGGSGEKMKTINAVRDQILERLRG